jgi:flagella basal body P-ring formation protein FlgA
LFAVALIMDAAIATASGAVFRLKSDVDCSSVLVQLGDVAEVVADTPQVRQSLESITLGLAPGTGKERSLSVDDIKDQLRRRGVNLAEHEFLGANRVRLIGPTSRAERPEPSNRPLPASSREQALAERNLQEAVRRFLARVGVEEAGALAIDATIPPDLVARLAASKSDQIEVSGGTAPWIGSQAFFVRVHENGTETPVPFNAELTLPHHVVVARHRLPRGVALEAGDVELVRLDTRGSVADGYGRLEDVVGQQTTQSIEPGQPITSRHVESIPLVRRGDVVTVVVRGPGFVVKRLARARGEGARGDSVALVTLEGRQQFMAEVVGVRELEVPAVGASARDPDRRLAVGQEGVRVR